MTDPLFSLSEGKSRLVISIPHAGIFVPPPLLRRLSPIGRDVVDTDWHVDRLYDFAAGLGATVLASHVSRSVVDLNRSPEGGLLYPGQAETGLCPTETFDGVPLYADPPGTDEIEERVGLYWRPYHDALRGQLDRVVALHGHVHLLDAHSIRSVVPRLFAGRLPDFNYGTATGRSASPELVSRALSATAGAGFTQVLDGRFRGGHITRHYGRPETGVHAIQLELAQACYLDEDAPHAYDEDRAGRVVAALTGLVRVLL